MQRELHWYFQHCKALRKRLEILGWSRGPAIDWLDAVVAGEDVPLLCTIDSPWKVVPIGTSHLLGVIGKHFRVAPDWGRKFLENALRLEGVQTRDIDRQMRHEVLGQESMSAISDTSERAFVHRLRPALDRISARLYPRHLFGLRRTGD
jgi:hypothetical protein